MKTHTKVAYAIGVIVAIGAAIVYGIQGIWSTTAWALISAMWMYTSYLWQRRALEVIAILDNAAEVIQVVLEKVDEWEDSGEFKVVE